jgi:hypothetical protein
MARMKNIYVFQLKNVSESNLGWLLCHPDRAQLSVLFQAESESVFLIKVIYRVETPVFKML